MRLDDFQSLVRRLSDEIPGHFFEGVAEVLVSPRVVPHPLRAEIYTLGECIPLWPDEGAASSTIQSRIVLYHGSFSALSQLHQDFDWREEAWETLTHELRHHLEWRARAPDLERFDRAAEQNFARQDGDRFDPTFYLDGESPVEGVYRVDDDYFLDRPVSAIPSSAELIWHGWRYRVAIPAGARPPSFLTVEGVREPPSGELVLVLRRKSRLFALFRQDEVFQAEVRAEPLERGNGG